jgi:hypothetical protein
LINTPDSWELRGQLEIITTRFRIHGRWSITIKKARKKTTEHLGRLLADENAGAEGGIAQWREKLVAAVEKNLLDSLGHHVSRYALD